MQCDPGPNVEACNAQGQSIQSLATAAMDLDPDNSSDEVPVEACPPSKRAGSRQTPDGADPGWHSAADDLDAESEWQDRLREESGAELRGGDEEDWDRCDAVSSPVWHRQNDWFWHSCCVMCIHNDMHHTIVRLLGALRCICILHTSVRCKCRAVHSGLDFASSISYALCMECTCSTCLVCAA